MCKATWSANWNIFGNGNTKNKSVNIRVTLEGNILFIISFLSFWLQWMCQTFEIITNLRLHRVVKIYCRAQEWITFIINKPSKKALLSSKFFRRISSMLRIGSSFISSSSGMSTYTDNEDNECSNTTIDQHTFVRARRFVTGSESVSSDSFLRKTDNFSFQ